MQSFLSVLVIVGALFVFAGNGAEGTAKKIYYLIAISLWMLAAFLAYIFYFGFTVPDTIRAGVVVELFGLEFQTANLFGPSSNRADPRRNVA